MPTCWNCFSFVPDTSVRFAFKYSIKGLKDILLSTTGREPVIFGSADSIFDLLKGFNAVIISSSIPVVLDEA